MSQTKRNQNGTNSSVGKTDVSVRKTLSNTTLCPAMRPFGTLAEAMRIRNIDHLTLIEGVAYMTLEEIADGKAVKREGVLHLGTIIKIKSQLVYEKYKNLIAHEINPCTFEEVRQKAQQASQGLFQGEIQKKQKKAVDHLAAENAL